MTDELIRAIEDAKQMGESYDLVRRTGDIYRRITRAMGRTREYRTVESSAQRVRIEADAGGTTKILDL